MQSPYLEIKGLYHKFNSNEYSGWTLADINIDVLEGELIGLLGPSGCGKTTLLRLIAGFDRPTSGKILFNGREISNREKVLPPENRGIGMVFQDNALFPHLNLWQNLIFGLKKKDGFHRAEWLIELLGLSELVNRYPHQLSGGQKQRLSLARALAPGSSLILLDEPFSSLDVQVRLRLRGELASVLRTCAATGIVVTHDPNEALAICDRVAVMSEGVLHQFSTPSSLVENQNTNFVSNFVFQNNELPIRKEKNYFSTPIGVLKLDIDDLSFPYRCINFGIRCIELVKTKNGPAIIKSIEYRITYLYVTILIGEFTLKVFSDLSEVLFVGDKCKLVFVKGAKVTLFPNPTKVSIL